MDINIEKLIAKIRNTEEVMRTHEEHAESLGYIDGADWQLVVTKDPDKSLTRAMHEDGLVPGRQDEYAGSNDFPKTAPTEGESND